MKRLSINEIKKDIKQGYEHTSYEHLIYGGSIVVIHDSRSQNILVMFETLTHRSTYQIPVTEFMEMTRKQFDDRLINELYYNSMPL